MEKYLKPGHFDADPSSSEADQEWKHWIKTFTCFVNRIITTKSVNTGFESSDARLKNDPLIDEVDLVSSNHEYATVRLSGGQEKHLVPAPQNLEVDTGSENNETEIDPSPTPVT
ncbi:unnamed protein product [Lepeophtheirus salmonis]|uniref:(salmon louse) hypothetical protein n=1 Tax=Lepeophtheirus salmonis TaxID=72036 RepID=A0A7R8D1S0_LEPSM|nr:unnamed protein product [Lepeophtheirus salmonis]CAF2971367.1 unnamed protein product [Lepeophtheirus salmonis]